MLNFYQSDKNYFPRPCPLLRLPLKIDGIRIVNCSVNFKRRKKQWLTGHSNAKIAARISFSPKANRLFIKKKASRTNRKDAPTAEGRRNKLADLAAEDN